MITEGEVFRFLIENPKLYKRFRHHIDTVVKFENQYLDKFWEWWGYHYKTNQRSPSYAWFHYAVSHHQKIPENWRDSMLWILGEMQSQPHPVNKDAVTDWFFERQHYKMMMEMQFVDFQKHDELIQQYADTKEFFETLREPDRISLESDFTAYKLFSEEAIQTSWSDLQELRSEKITTGHDVWDWMLGGGWPLGTFVVCHGKSGEGKTLVLGDQAINGFLQTDNIRTVFFALDVKRKEMYARLRAKVSNLPLGYDPDLNESIYLDRLRRGIGDRPADRFQIVRGARGLKTVRDIKEVVRKVEEECYDLDIERGYDEEEAGKVDAVYIDYLTLVRANGLQKDKRLQVDEVCLDLIGWAEDENKLMHVGAQSSKLGNYQETLDDTSVGEHFGIKHHSAFFYNLARNKQDKINNRVRLFHSKARDEQNDFVVHMNMHKRTMSLSFNPQAGVTYADGNIHSDWARMNPDRVKEILPAEEQAKKTPKPQKTKVAGPANVFG